MVVVAKQVAKAVDGQPGQLAKKPALATAPTCGFDGDDDIAKKHAVGSGIRLPAEFLLMKAEHVGGAVELAIVAIKRAHFFIAREQQRDLAAGTVKQTQGQPQARAEVLPKRVRHQRARRGPNKNSDLAHSTRL